MREVVLGTGEVLDEHVVAEIHYDTKFLEAMAQARARAALFESESRLATRPWEG